MLSRVIAKNVGDVFFETQCINKCSLVCNETVKEVHDSKCNTRVERKWYILPEIIHTCVKWQGEEEAMFLEYRKELRVIFNNLGALVSHCNLTDRVIIGWRYRELEAVRYCWLYNSPVCGLSWCCERWVTQDYSTPCCNKTSWGISNTDKSQSLWIIFFACCRSFSTIGRTRKCPHHFVLIL